jgi:hypothetical protein
MLEASIPASAGMTNLEFCADLIEYYPKFVKIIVMPAAENLIEFDSKNPFILIQIRINGFRGVLLINN